MARNDTEHAKREESASNRWKSGKIAPASTLPVILIRQRHRRWYCFSTTTRPLVLVCTCTFALSPHAGRTAEPEVAGKECTVGGNPTVFLRGFPAGCRRHTGLPVCHGTKGRGSLISDVYKPGELKRRYVHLLSLFAVVCIFYHDSLQFRKNLISDGFLLPVFVSFPTKETIFAV